MFSKAWWKVSKLWSIYRTSLHTERERGREGERERTERERERGISCQKPRLRAKVFEDSGRDKSTRRYIPVSSRIDSNELFESFSIDYYASCRISIKQLCLPRYTNQGDNPLLFRLRCFQRSHSIIILIPSDQLRFSLKKRAFIYLKINEIRDANSWRLFYT